MDILHPLAAPLAHEDEAQAAEVRQDRDESSSAGEGAAVLKLTDPVPAPVYFSQLYVHVSSPYQSLEDLRGKVFAYNDDASLSGYHCMRFLLADRFGAGCRTPAESEDGCLKNRCEGSDLDSSSRNCGGNDSSNGRGNSDRNILPFFSAAVATGSHLASLAAVVAQRADVACLDCTVLAQVRQAGNADSRALQLLDQVRPLPVHPVGSVSQQRVGPNPAQPVVASSRLSANLRDRITAALTRLRRHTHKRNEVEQATPLLAPMLASRYVAVDATHYEHVGRAMLRCRQLDILVSGEGSCGGTADSTQLHAGHCYKPPMPL